MKYVIVSPRLGKPGDVYNPETVINLGALIAGGFIKALDKADSAEETAEESAPAPVKSAKTNSKKSATEE